jgi:protocatechuate 3,4-dioxygenase beta subunit
MASRAKRAAARRRQHESQANPTQPRDPALSAAWKELQVLLDEEIQRLPEGLRAPFVLCCLENTSYAKAAQQLGLQEGKVRNRLGRARKRLQERLTRRGVSLTAVLAAIALSAEAASAAVPRSLVGSMVEAATQLTAGQALTGGMVSANVLTLVQGVNRAMFLSKCKTAILLLLGTALAGSGLGLAVLRGVGAAPALPARQAAPAAAREGSKKERQQPADAPAQARAKDSAKVRGRVLDPDGKPFAGAKLSWGQAGLKKRVYPVRATSGDDGTFAFLLTKSELQKIDSDDQAYQVLAIVKGYGCAWATADATAEKLTLRLVQDAPVKGRILDADGRPVAGAKLTVTGVAAKGHDGQPGARGWEGPLPEQAEVLTTGTDGRFQLAGAGSDRVVKLRLEGRGIATARFDAQGAAFEYQAALSRPIRGMVRDKATRKPLAGVTVTNGYGGLCEAVTDKEGRYELLGVAKAAQYRLDLKPAAGQLYFQRMVGVQDKAGLEALTADCELVRGTVTVRGKVTDKATGKPVVGARVVYRPFYGNETAAKMDVHSWPRGGATTGADGTYALPVMPGPGLMLVAGPRPHAYMPAWSTREERKAFFKPQLMEGGFPVEGTLAISGGGAILGAFGQEGYHAVVLLEPGEKEEALVRDVALERPKERKGRVVGPDGQPLIGVMVAGLGPGGAVKGDEFTVRGLNPKAPAPLLTFHHKDKNLGAFLKGLPPEKDGPLIVKLRPCGSLSGRIVDQDGQPIAGFRGGFSPSKPGGGYLDGPGFTTDKEGRFRVEGLVPGLEYSFFQIGRKTMIMAWPIRPNTVVESGKNKDLSDIQAENFD